MFPIFIGKGQVYIFSVLFSNGESSNFASIFKLWIVVNQLRPFGNFALNRKYEQNILINQ